VGEVIDAKYGKVVTEKGEFHEGEPVFILRGQDLLALAAIDEYGGVCDEAGVEDDHLIAVAEVYNSFVDWQSANPNLVSLPD
jgi:hypothetical protein